MLSDMPKAMELVSDRGRIWTQAGRWLKGIEITGRPAQAALSWVLLVSPSFWNGVYCGSGGEKEFLLFPTDLEEGIPWRWICFLLDSNISQIAITSLEREILLQTT